MRLRPAAFPACFVTWRAAVLLAATLLCPLHAQAGWETNLSSPDATLTARLGLDEQGRPWYQLLRDGEPVIRPSPLGIRLRRTAFEQDLTVAQAPPVETVSDHYRMWVGKRREITYRANELKLTLRNRDGELLVLALRLSDDGLAYRYEFPGESTDPRSVVAERSGVHFFPGTRAWLQPKAEAQSGWMNTNPSYEEDYLQDIAIGTPSPTSSGWVYPALFRYGDTWIVLSETGMDGRYCGSNLAAASDDGLYRIRFPEDAEVVTGGGLLPQAPLPFHSPWRLLVVGDLQTIMDSTLGTDLAVPSMVADTSFIQPGIAAWSWGLLKDDSVVDPVQRDFVDYAAWMHWPYVLVDVDWDQNIGFERIAELSAYAGERGVGLLLWYNSSGAWNQTVYSPKSRLLTRSDRRAEFARIHGLGVRGVKVDFFPGDGQSVMQYYQDMLQDAADFRLQVNFHGTTLPRGLQRTWPNLLTAEAVKGFEFVTFAQENADREATHAAMLPFTRNLFDPMDFTPMVLGDIPNIERRTSNGFELALPVLFTSGIQHLVATPAQMQAMPGFVRDYLRALPGQWDDSRFVAGFPGRFVVIARRSGNRWYVAGINAEAAEKVLQLDLPFTGGAGGVLIRDGAEARAVEQVPIDGTRQTLDLPPSAGFVMIFNP